MSSVLRPGVSLQDSITVKSACALMQPYNVRDHMTTESHKQLPRNFMPETVDQNSEDSEIARFYQDRAVFITGGTGFIGKVLLEKLLRSCPGLKRAYLLVRSKRGVEPRARLEMMFNSEVTMYNGILFNLQAHTYATHYC